MKESRPPVKAVAHRGPVYAVDWERESRYLLTAAADGCCVLWDTETAPGRALCRYRAHAGPSWDVRWSDLSRGHLFAVAGADKTTRVFATDRVEALRVLVGHWADVSCCAWHPNAHYVLSGSHDKQARLWDLRAGKTARVLADATAALTATDVSPDGKYAAAGCADGSVHVWNLDSAKRLGSYVPPSFSTPVAATLTASPAPAPAPADAASQPTPPQKAPAKRKASAISAPPTAAAAIPSPPTVYSLAFSADGAALAAGGRDQTLRLFTSINDHAALQAHHLLKTKATPIFDLTWTRANLCLVSGPLLL